MPTCATLLVPCLLAVTWAAASTAAAEPASLAVVNARIFTGNPDQPWATALAVRDGRFVAVSTDASQAEVRAVCGASTRVVDAHGALATPGFIDSHIHLMVYDVSRKVPPLFLRFVRGRHSVAEKIAARAAALPEGSWILGEEWTDETWGGPLPDKAWLDALAPRHLVWLTGREGNAGIANSAALRAAGIDARTSAVPPGSVVRSRRSEPTGVILGGAMWRVDDALIASTREQDERALQQTFQELLRTGVTSVHHNNDWRDFLVLRRMHQEGKLPLRVYASPPLPAWQRMRDYIEEYGHGDEWMHWGALKGYGAIDEANYRRWVTAASAAGLRIMVHVGSTPELRTLLGIFEQVKQQHLKDPRFRVEHAHDMPADIIPKMLSAGAIASWQPPLLLHSDQRTAAGLAPRPESLFPCRALLNVGVKIAFGTDRIPGEPIIPVVESLRLALERAAPDGSRLTLEQGLRAFTVDAAYAEFAEREKGSIQVHRLADFVVFEQDFTRFSPSEIARQQVRMTVAGGVVRYERDRATAPARQLAPAGK
jgi:predicted amidohydrolase YtcJ